MKFTLKDESNSGVKTFFGILAILFLLSFVLCIAGTLIANQQVAQEQITHDAQYGPQADSHGNLSGSVVGRYTAPKPEPQSGVDY